MAIAAGPSRTVISDRRTRWAADVHGVLRSAIARRSASRDAAHEKALRRGLHVPVFTADLFTTGNDADDRAAVAAVPGSGLDLLGLAVHAGRNAVDKLLKGARMHP